MIKKFCAVVCGIALTWACAAFGIFLLAGRGDTPAREQSTAIWRVAGVARAVADYKFEKADQPVRPGKDRARHDPLQV